MYLFSKNKRTREEYENILFHIEFGEGSRQKSIELL